MEESRKIYISNITKVIRETFELQSPVDLDYLINQLEGKLVEESNFDQNMEAKIQKVDDTFIITIDPTKFDKRKRFSIAHELGHLFLHMGYLINPEKWNNTNEYVDSVYYRYGYNIEEFEANEFAASLLMPLEEFIDISQCNLENGLYNIEKIAEYFDVSTQAVTNRGKFIGIFRSF